MFTCKRAPECGVSNDKAGIREEEEKGMFNVA
jgi:hypothetical protein